MTLLHYYWKQIKFSAIFWPIFASFSQDIQPNATFLTDIIAIGSNFLKKPQNIPVYSHLVKNIEENTKKMTNMTKFQGYLQYQGKILGEKLR